MPESKNISNSREFEGATFDTVSFAGASFKNVTFMGAKLEGLFINAEISGPIDGLKVNDVEVAPLIQAELERRHPELSKFTSTDLAEVREGLDVLSEQLAATWDRARALSEEERNRGVDGEWSVVETVRHLVFVVDLWLRRQALGLGNPYDPIGLPPSHLPAAPPGTAIDVNAHPSFDEAMAVWEGRLAEVRDVLDALTPETADASEPADAPGFPPLAKTVPKRRAITVVLREAWSHNRYMIRDLDKIEAAAPTS